MIQILVKIVNKLASVWRRFAFVHHVESSGENVKILGKIYLINRNIICGDNLKLYPGVQFFGDGPITIGNNVDIGNGTILYAAKGAGITIGDDTLIAAQSYVIDTDHGVARGELIRTQENSSAPIIIGKDVWISAGCKILKGSTIEDGAVIGAMSLVKGRIPSNAIAYGMPAKVARERE